MAFDAPVRQSFFVEMVGKEDLMNAIALNSSIFNAARILGPAIAGILIASVGVGGCFFINGVSFLAVIMGLLLMRGDFSPSYTIMGSVIENIKEGVRYMWDDKKIVSYISLIATTSIFGMPYLMLMPVFARDYLHVGPQGLGTLMASVGMGALVAALMLATLGDFEKKGFFMLAGSITFTVALITFSFSESYPFSLFLLILGGWGMITQTATINTLLQTRVPDNMRGRVMSAYTLTFMGFQPLGSFQAGVVAQQLGAPMAVRIGGIACGLVLLFFMVRRRDVYTS
jgi:predicted MFS family arabinose efflux permease